MLKESIGVLSIQIYVDFWWNISNLSANQNCPKGYNRNLRSNFDHCGDMALFGKMFGDFMFIKGILCAAID